MDVKWGDVLLVQAALLAVLLAHQTFAGWPSWWPMLTASVNILLFPWYTGIIDDIRVFWNFKGLLGDEVATMLEFLQLYDVEPNAGRPPAPAMYVASLRVTDVEGIGPVPPSKMGRALPGISSGVRAWFRTFYGQAPAADDESLAKNARADGTGVRWMTTASRVRFAAYQPKQLRMNNLLEALMDLGLGGVEGLDGLAAYVRAYTTSDVTLRDGATFTVCCTLQPVDRQSTAAPRELRVHITTGVTVLARRRTVTVEDFSASIRLVPSSP